MKKRSTCNVVLAHKRILEAHRLWHQAFQYYFDPEGFRTNVNATIQALRNITFALQNNKQNIRGFDSWYKNWQEKLKNDDIMRWLCDARTEIVHKKDLAMYSSATVTIKCYATILQATMNIPPFLSGKFILDHLTEQGIINEAHKEMDAYAIIERRWVVDSFPQHDVLFLLAYGIGQLLMMIEEAHSLSGIKSDSCSVVDSLHQITLSDSGIPVCMESFKNPMREIVGLRDYATRVFSYTSAKMCPKLDARVRKKYKSLLKNFEATHTDDPFDFADSLFSIAKQLLQKDGHHANILYLLRANQTCTLSSPVFNDQASKYIFWNSLAEQVRKDKIVAIIFIAERWVGSLEEYEKTGLRASNQPNRGEALGLEVFTSDLRGREYLVTFHRNLFGKVVFDEEHIEEIKKLNIGYIKPVYDVWKAEKDNQ